MSAPHTFRVWRLFALALLVALLFAIRTATAAVQQDTRVIFNNDFVDGSSTTSSLSFAPGSVGSQVLEVHAAVLFQKSDGEAFGVNNGGTPYFNEILLETVSPGGTTVGLIMPGDFNQGVGTGGFGMSSINFRAGSGYSLVNVNPNSPQAGSFRATGDLRNFEGEGAEGTWTLNIGDTVPQDGLSVRAWGIRIYSGDPVANVNGTGNFGDVLVGTSADQLISVSNGGDARAITNDGTVVSTRLSGTFGAPVGADFSLVGSNAFTDILVGGATADRDYRFSPNSRGLLATTAQVATDGGNATVNLTGRGVAPVAQVDVSATDAGLVRIGDTGTATIMLNNVGDGNLSGLGAVSNLNGDFNAESGLFSSGGQSFSLPDAAATFETYTYAPTMRGLDSADVALSLDNGNPDGTNTAINELVQLTGRAVGPEFASTGDLAGLLDFGAVALDDNAALSFSLFNQSPDGDLGSFTDLSIADMQITGPNADQFRIVSFAPAVLSSGSGLDVMFEFQPTALGMNNATLEIFTDQGAAFGDVGTMFSFDLQGFGTAAVPEPSTFAVMVLGALLLGVFGRRRRKR